MQSITVKNNQTVLDVAVKHSGSVEDVFATAGANGLSLTDDLNPGKQLQPINNIKNREITEHFRTELKDPASRDDSDFANGEGVGFWQLGTQFIIS